MNATGSRAFAVTFGLAIVLVVYREIKQGRRFPEPKAVMAVIWVWAFLALFVELGAQALATGLGTGLVVALAYNSLGEGTQTTVGSSRREAPDTGRDWGSVRA